MSSQRKAILQGVQLLLQGVQDPATSAALLQDVKLGAYFGNAMASFASWAEVTPFQGKSGPYGSGGTGIGWRIQDDVTLMVTCGWDYEADSTAAVLAYANAADILLPILHSHVTIPSPLNPSQPIGSTWEVRLQDLPDTAIPVRVPPGHIYLLWKVHVVVRQQYNIQFVSP